MHIHLTQEELNYMHQAIDEWHLGAQEHIKKMENYSYPQDYDGYDPCPPGKAIMMTQARIRQVKSWTSEMNASWEKNEGKIDFQFFYSKILKYSVHKDMQSPILLSIQQKMSAALQPNAVQNSQLQKQGLFAASSNVSEQKIDSIATNPPGGLQVPSNSPGGLPIP